MLTLDQRIRAVEIGSILVAHAKCTRIVLKELVYCSLSNVLALTFELT